MGSDDLHHKRKARRKRSLERRKSRRESYDRVLIVCEGSKTEPNYFRELIDYLNVNRENVEIDGSCGSSPISVVNHAKRRYRDEYNKGDAYDRIFCVFDKDIHTSYSQAIKDCRNARPTGLLKAIPSVPCFEFWLLLHFEFSTKPYNASGTASACDRLIRDLRGYMPSYAKGNKCEFESILRKTDQAIVYSKQALHQVTGSGADDPTTRMHELVEYLQQLRIKT